jgi:membrane fusion protein (multidrug efflux system)
MVTPGMPLYHIVDLSILKLEVGISQDIISRVKVGSQAEISMSSFPDEKFIGEVKYISPQASENSGSFLTEIHLQNTADQKILAGMTAKVSVKINNFGDRLIIPDYSLVTMNEKVNVYKVNGSLAKLKEIKVEEKIGSAVLVDDGIALGDTIVVVGMQNLGVDTKINIEVIH